VGAIAGAVGGAAAGATNYALGNGPPEGILFGAAFGAIGGAVAPGLYTGFGEGWGGAIGSGAILGGAFGGVNAAIGGGNIVEGIVGGAISGALVSAAVYGGYDAWAGLRDTNGVGGSPACGSDCWMAHGDLEPGGVYPRLEIEGMLGGNERVSSSYGVWRSIGTSPHNGIDIVAPGLRWNTPIYAPQGCNPCIAGGQIGGGFTFQSGSVTNYAYHGQLTVAPGTHVYGGHQVGVLRAFPPASGPNLHISVWQNRVILNPHHVYR
jgi:hypothetical protein